MNAVSIKTSTQLTIYLSHRPGSLARACDALANAKINIEALASEGTSAGTQGDEMLVRMVVNEPARAIAILGEIGATAIQTDVLLIESAHQPGILAKIADRLAKAEINIESIYVSAGSEVERCVTILRPSNVEQAARVLRDLQ